MDKNRLLELAIAELVRQRAAIDEDIATVRAELRGAGSTVRQMTSPASVGTQRGRKRTAAERKAQAKRMRDYWAVRRAKAATRSNAKTLATSKAKPRKMTDAQKKAISLKMKEAWKRRKAAAAKQAK